MSFKQAVCSAFHNYANFKGRARRSEFWYFYLFVGLGSFAIMFIATMAVLPAVTRDKMDEAMTIIGLANSCYALAVLIPMLAAFIRRLHDVGKSGADLLWFFLPVLGAIKIFCWLIQDGEPRPNKYGPDPKKPTGRFKSKTK